jgi:hypothetical protein
MASLSFARFNNNRDGSDESDTLWNLVINVIFHWNVMHLSISFIK